MTLTLTVNGERYTAVPTEVYDRMVKRLGGELPELPPRHRSGRRPALAAGRAILARKLIRRRAAAGWTQAQLAKLAGVRTETVSRLESGKHKPHEATLVKLDDALRKAGS